MLDTNLFFPYRPISRMNDEMFVLKECALKETFILRRVPTIVIAHTFCASPDTRISYRQYLLIQGYFCAA